MSSNANEILFTLFGAAVMIGALCLAAGSAEKHSSSLECEAFILFGTPPLLWGALMLVYEIVKQKGFFG